MNSSKALQPAPLALTLGIFGISSLLIFTGLYVIMPLFLSSGLTFLNSYFILFYLPFVLLFIMSLIFFRLEENDLSWSSFKDRFRLKKLDKNTILWTLALFVFWFFVLLVVQPIVGSFFAKLPLFAPPAYFPPEINPNVAPAPAGTFMGAALLGKWWIPLCYFIGWFFNIFGEELLFRGYLLPRHELAYGKHAWIVQGVIWGLWHFFWKWNVVTLMLCTLSLAFVVQKTKNTWAGIIVHGVLNFVPLIMIILNVIG